MIDQKKIEPQLAMVRHLEDLEEVKLPPGYDLKHYRPGDAGAWEAIISEAFGREIKFENTMRYDYPYRPERIQFITWNGIPVATASAWYRPKWGRNTGYLHMVGVRSEHAGHRLGYLVSLAALKLMVQEKRDRAVLNTDDFRIPALKTYLRLGFKPLLYHENQRERWEHIFEETGYHHLCEKYSFILNGPLYIPVEEKADSDSPENYSPARRWYPDRPHKLGTGNIDSLGDESLYKPSKLGSASVSPAEITAGSKDCLRLSYTSGPDGLARGTKIIFYIGGQNALTVQARKKNNTSGDDWPFERLQTVPVKAYGPPDTELDVSQKPAKQVEVRIAEGRLGPGDTIHIQAGPDEGFPWTPLAGRYETKVIIDPGNGEPKQRLESPLVIRVLPRELHQLETVVSSTHNGNMGIKMVTTARDIFDNRVPLSGDIQICGNGESISAHMENGFCGVTLEPEKFRTIRFKTVHTESGISTESNPSPRLSGKQLYIGDLHVHDFMSAAWGYTDEIYRWAKEDRNLDFVSIPVQVHGWLDNEKWTIAKFMNERHLDEGNFVTLLANEWQHTGYADKVIHFLGGDQPYFCVDDSRYSSAQKLYEAARSSDALIISHHCSYPEGSWCSRTDFEAIEPDVERLVELWSMHGSSEGYDTADRPLRKMDKENTVLEALRRGLRVGFVAGSDTHSGRPGGSLKEPYPYWGGLAAVWADNLTRRDLFSALYARHTYALTGARIVLRMTVNGHLMGSELPPSDTAEIKIDVWAPGNIESVQLLKNGCCIEEIPGTGQEIHAVRVNSTGGAAFYHCRVAQKDGNIAVGSPVWIG